MQRDRQADRQRDRRIGKEGQTGRRTDRPGGPTSSGPEPASSLSDCRFTSCCCFVCFEGGGVGRGWVHDERHDEEVGAV